MLASINLHSCTASGIHTTNNTNDLLIPYLLNALPTVYSAERHGMTIMMQTLYHGHSLLMESSIGQILNHTHTHTGY